MNTPQNLEAELAAIGDLARLKAELETVVRERDEHRTATLFMLEDLEENRKRIERARQEWVQVFDGVRDPIFVHDREFRIVRCNRAYAERGGMLISEVIGKRYWEVFPKRDGPLPGCYALVKEEEEEEVEEEVEVRVGGDAIFLSRNFLVHDAAGVFLFAVHIMKDITERKQAEAARQEYAKKLERSLEETIQAVALTVEMRDPYTAGHQRRVAGLAAAIAAELGLSKEQIRSLQLAGVIHDLGKIHIPAEILSKPGKLTDIEFSFIKTHPQAGYDILKDVEFPWPIAQIVLQHHERLDGSGYPQELKAGQILLEARILAVADVVEAMASHRPYRPALGLDAALNEIIRNRGTQFDTAVVDACVRLFKEKGFVFAHQTYPGRPLAAPCKWSEPNPRDDPR